MIGRPLASGPHRLISCGLVALTLIAVSIVALGTDTDTVDASIAVRTFEVSGDYAVAERITPPPPPSPPFASVGIVGDSLFVGITERIYLGAPTLQERLQALGSTTWAEAQVGMTMPRGEFELRRRAAALAANDTLVVGLGTNDIFNSGGMARTAWQREIRELVATARAINPNIRIIWVDVAFQRVDDRAVAFNADLRALATGLDFDVCAWRSILLAHPEWLAGDRLHLTGAGYRARVDVIVDCIIN